METGQYRNGSSGGIMTRVFVYGTLRTGLHNNHWLGERPDKFGLTRTRKASFTMLDTGRGFPGVLDTGETRIIGEVYGINAATMRELDRHEGFPTHYDRIIVATVEHGLCEMYRYRHAERIGNAEGIVISGDWLEHWFEETAKRQPATRRPGKLVGRLIGE